MLFFSMLISVCFVLLGLVQDDNTTTMAGLVLFSIDTLRMDMAQELRKLRGEKP